MNKEQILSKIYSDKEYDKAIRNICKDKVHFFDDLKQELFLALLQKPEEVLIELYTQGKLKFYFVRMVMNQVNSNGSPFYRKYRMLEYNHESATPVESVTVQSEDEDIACISCSFDILQYIKDNKILNWDQVELFNLYYRLHPSFLEEDISVQMSYLTIAKKLGLSKPNISQQINSVKYKIFRFMIADSVISEVINKEYITDFIQKYEQANIKIKSNEKSNYHSSAFHSSSILSQERL